MKIGSVNSMKQFLEKVNMPKDRASKTVQKTAQSVRKESLFQNKKKRKTCFSSYFVAPDFRNCFFNNL